jgi:hypothetical protein
MDDEAAVELYIDTGDKDENKKVFDDLFARRTDVERTFGAELSRERLDDKRACRVRHLITKGGLNSGEDAWPAIQDAMIDAMARLAKALKPHLPGVSA